MQRVDDWLNEAFAEQRAARDLFQGKHWSWCCFTCQQATEKVLKAMCEYYRIPQYGHNLNQLLQTVGTRREIQVSVQAACARLNRYYIPTRYPDAFSQGAPADQFFEDDANQALADMDLVITFAKKSID